MWDSFADFCRHELAVRGDDSAALSQLAVQRLVLASATISAASGADDISLAVKQGFELAHKVHGLHPFKSMLQASHDYDKYSLDAPLKFRSQQEKSPHQLLSREVSQHQLQLLSVASSTSEHVT